MPIYSQTHMKYEKASIATPPIGRSSAVTKFKDAKIVKIPDDFKSWPVKNISDLDDKIINMNEKKSTWKKYSSGNLNINKEIKTK